MGNAKKLVSAAFAFSWGVSSALAQVDTVTNQSGSSSPIQPVDPAQPGSPDANDPNNPSVRPRRQLGSLSMPVRRTLAPRRGLNTPANNGGIIRVVGDAARGNPVGPTPVGTNPDPVIPDTSAPRGNRAPRVITRLSEVPAPPGERIAGVGMGIGMVNQNPRVGLRSPTSVATATLMGGRVAVSWSDNANNEAGFCVERRGWTGTAWGAAVELRFDANVERGLDQPGRGIFAYRVCAVRAGEMSRATAWELIEVLEGEAAPIIDTPQPRLGNAGTPGNGNGNGNGAPPTGPTPPVAQGVPTNLAANDAGQRSATVRWSAVGSDTSRYEMERSPAFRGGLVRVDGNVTQYTDASGAGEFRYRVRAVGAGGASEFTDWTLALVTDIAPSAPASLAAVSLNDFERVRITWTDTSDNERGFRVERETRDATGAWVSGGAFVAARNSMEVIDEPGPGVWRYRAAAVNAVGASPFSDWTDVVVAPRVTQGSGETTPPLGTAPDAPTGLVAADGGANNATISWTDATSDELRFEVERDPAFAGGRVRVNANIAAYTDGCGPGEFSYRVRAVNAVGNGVWSDWAGVTVHDQAPAAPTALQAFDEADGTRVQLHWVDNADNENGFRVEHQRRAGVVWSTTRAIAVRANEIEVADAPGPGEHRYRIAAANPSGYSAYTPWESVTVEVPPTDPGSVQPAAPGTMSASDLGNRRAGVLWADLSSNELGFQLQRDPAFAGGTVTISANTSGYVDDTGAGTYAYRVRAFNNAGYSQWTEWAQVTVLETEPQAPSGARAVDLGNQSDVQVAWADNSGNEDGFRVERETWTGTGWGEGTSRLASANVTSTIDSAGLGRFRYRVQAVNAAGNSTPSEWAVATVTGGWTPILVSQDSRVIYVSSSDGSDTNDGLSADRAKRTIAAADELLRNGFPDHLRLKRGDTFLNQKLGPAQGTWWRSGRSETEPMVVHTYGSAPERPMVKVGDKEYGVRFQNSDDGINHVWIVGLHFQANTRIPGAEFVADQSDGRQSQGVQLFARGEDLLFEDCMFESFFSNMTIMGTGANGKLRNFRVRRSVLADAYAGVGGHSQGIFTADVDGALIEECVLDHNGWSTWDTARAGTIFNHNGYFSASTSNLIFRNNITARASATGGQFRGVNNVVLNNLVLRNPIGILLGHAELHWPDQSGSGGAEYNVVLGSRDIAAGTAQVQVRGMGIEGQHLNGSRMAKNLVAHDLLSTGGLPALCLDRPCLNVSIEDNIVYNWTGTGQYKGSGVVFSRDRQPASVEFRRNTIMQPNGASAGGVTRITEPGGTFVANRYFSTASQDTGWFSVSSEPIPPAVWAQRSNDPQAVFQETQFPDPARTVEGYMAHLGHATPTFESFMLEARRQSRMNWRPEFTAAVVNRYVREGFGMSEPTAGSTGSSGVGGGNNGE